MKEATDLEPSFGSAYVNLGLAYLRVNDWEKASGSLSRALELNKNDFIALTNLATAYYWDGKYELARQRFEQAVKLDPESPVRHMNLGDALDALGRSPEAREAYATAVKLATLQLPKKFDARTAGVAAKCEAKLRHDADPAMGLTGVGVKRQGHEVVWVAVVYALTGRASQSARQQIGGEARQGSLGGYRIGPQVPPE